MATNILSFIWRHRHLCARTHKQRGQLPSASSTLLPQFGAQATRSHPKMKYTYTQAKSKEPNKTAREEMYAKYVKIGGWGQ